MAKNSGIDEVKQLINLGKEKGFLTYDEVNDLLPPDLYPDQLDDIMNMFGEMDIDIVDSAKKFKITNGTTESPDRRRRARGNRAGGNRLSAGQPRQDQ